VTVTYTGDVRVWVVSGVLVAIAVAVYLGVTGEDPPRREGKPLPAPTRPLSEAEIRTYLKVWPKLNETLMGVAMRETQRKERGVSDPEAAAAAQAAIDAVFAKHHQTRASWQVLSQRIRYVVERVRWANDTETRNADLDKKIAEKEALLEPATDKGRALLEKDLETLREARAFQPPPIPASDLSLVKSFWADLDRHVPVTGTPRKRQ